MDLARKGRALAPDDPTVAHALGRIEFEGGQSAELQWANSLLQESARRLPDDAEVAYDLAWSYFSLGDVAEAKAAAKAALNSKSRFTRADDARRFLAHLSGEADIVPRLAEQSDYTPAVAAAAAMYERDNQLLEAQRAYQTVLSRFPLFYPAHYRLAVIFDKQGNLAKALEHAEQAREQAANDPEIAKTLGIITFKRGDFARSAQLLRESGRRRRGDAELFYYLGMAHYRLRQHAESKQALRQAVALNVAPAMAQEANRVLAEMN